MELRNQDIKTLLKEYEGKIILIVCKNSYKYRAHNLKVFEDYVKFVDKFDSSVIIHIDEIVSVQEVKK
jgi:hypothetical protein